MSDFITILTNGSRRLAKKWVPVGDPLAYEDAKVLSMQTPKVTDIRHLSRILTKIEAKTTTAVIRGQYRGDEVLRGLYQSEELPDGKVYRRKDLFADCPHQWVMFDVDGFVPLLCDPIADPLGAMREYIEDNLPSEFHDITYHWQLSNTHGHPKNQGVLKAHLWFWLDTPYPTAQLKAWVLHKNINADLSTFDTIQWHYTARPVMDTGVTDPIAVRSGLQDGLMGDAVPLGIDSSLEIPLERTGGYSGEYLGDCPVAQFLEDQGSVVGGDSGALFLGDCGCPRGHLHTSNTGASSVAWMMPGTGGFVHGRLVCKHTSCQTPEAGGPITNQEFFDHIGYVYPANEFVALPAIPKEKELPSFANRTKLGEIKATIEQTVVALRSEVFLGLNIGYDRFTDELCIGNKGKWQPLADEDYTKLRIMLESRGFLPVGRELIRDATLLVAKENTFDSAQDWIAGLQWDGVPRIDSFFTKYFGTDDCEYHKLVGRYLWSALAGRIIEPGVKADMVPILEGAQGVRKSSAVEALVPNPQFFTEIALDEKEDNIARKTRGVLVIEVPELDGLHTKRVEGIKAFVTRRVEKWVPKYREFGTRMPRRSIIIGTTNSDELLADDSGNRRWLPMHVVFADVPGIVTIRDQLWAEGAHVFNTLGVCWQGLDVLSLPAHERYAARDPWVDTIGDWLNQVQDFTDGKVGLTNGEGGFKTNRVMREALGIADSNQSRVVTTRVTSALRKLGFESGTVRINKKSEWGWKKVA